MNDGYMAIALVVVAFPVLFVGFWCLVCCLIARIGGWRELAREFPGDDPPGAEIDRIGWISMRIGFFGNYRSAVNVRVFHAGLHLRPILVFQACHPPVFIPWPSISRWEHSPGLWSRTAFTAGNLRLTVFGHAGERLTQHLPASQRPFQ